MSQGVSGLEGLPVELTLRILAFCDDFATVHAFSACSRALRAVFDGSRELVYFLVCINLRLTDPQTCAAGATSTLEATQADETPSGSLPSELAKAIAGRMSMSDVFDTCTTWEAFGKCPQTALQIDRNWEAGRYSLEVALRPNSRQQELGPIWRIKLDARPENRFFVCSRADSIVTGRMVGSPASLTAIIPEASLTTIIPDAGSHPHVELSGPALITSIDRGFVIWMLEDRQRRPPDETLPSLQPSIPVLATGGRRRQFAYARQIAPPVPCYCFKARYPYLAAATMTSEVFLWDVRTGKCVQHIERIGPVRSLPTYIELDNDFVFLAGPSGVTVHHRRSDAAPVKIPHLPPPSEPSDPWDHHIIGVEFFDVHSPSPYRSGGQVDPEDSRGPKLQTDFQAYLRASIWTAVHHDCQGGHLVAITSNGWLMWTPRYKELIESRGTRTEDLVFVHLGGSGLQLAVENGRAVITVECAPDDRDFEESRPSCESILLLNLRTWRDFDDFKRDPPQLITLAARSPAMEPVSRVEMDSTAVYITGTAACVTNEHGLRDAMAALGKGATQEMWECWREERHWRDIEGTILGKAWGREEPSAVREPYLVGARAAYNKILNAVETAGVPVENDAILRFSFE